MIGVAPGQLSGGPARARWSRRSEWAVGRGVLSTLAAFLHLFWDLVVVRQGGHSGTPAVYCDPSSHTASVQAAGPAWPFVLGCHMTRPWGRSRCSRAVQHLASLGPAGAAMHGPVQYCRHVCHLEAWATIHGPRCSLRKLCDRLHNGPVRDRVFPE